MTMTDSNEQVVRNLFAAIGRGDEAAIRRLLADDVVYYIAGHHQFAGEYRGQDAVLELRDRQRAHLTGRPQSVEQLIDLGTSDEHVFVCFQGRAESPRTGKPLNWRTVTVYRVRDGRVTERRTHLDNVDDWDDFWS
jgi:ketosteroid isomerase-like protein